MANKKWDDLKTKTFFVLLAFLVLGLLSWITDEGDPVDAIWEGFWIVVWIVGSFAILSFLAVVIREWWSRGRSR
jgi:hypothetical protein